MTGADVNFHIPLMRLNPWYPGQFGVEGAWTDTGLRSHCTGTVFYVSPNHPGASDSRDGTDPNDPLLTVATAIARCESYRGDVIAVMHHADWPYSAGTPYPTGIYEEVTLDKHGVRLMGLSNSSVGVPWTPASDAGTCITVAALDCVIEGFAFDEGAYTGCDAIYCEWDGATLWGENLTVRNCLFTDTVDTAIQLEYSWYCDIHHNYFHENDVVAIMVDVAGSGVDYTQIHDNVFHDCALAMSLLGGCDDAMIWNNSIYNANAQSGAAAANEGINTTGGRQNQVFNNYFSCLLPVPANGDWNDLNTAAATDAWIGNHCMNGLATTNPT
jgi:hypothetical protein